MTPVSSDQSLNDAVCGILGTSDINFCEFQAGGNNRLLLVEQEREKLIVKRYFQSGEDSARRQTAEWMFLVHAGACEVSNVPKPVGIDRERCITVMTYLTGQKISGAPEKHHVREAANFIRKINSKEAAAGNKVPDAAEAGFSFLGHSELLEVRLNRLLKVADKSEYDEAFAILVQDMQKVHDLWIRRMEQSLLDSGLCFDEPLNPDERVISPSDFGFHNILIDKNDELQFLDFEYAGWDDPAKLICDFFWQPAFPVDRKYRDDFIDICVGNSWGKEDISCRVKLLDPLFGLRWCCIILNPFLPEWAPRQSFVDPEKNLKRLQMERLDKAGMYLNKIKNMMS